MLRLLGSSMAWVSDLPKRLRERRFYMGEGGGVSDTQGAFHLSELTGQTLPVVMRISLLIKTIQPDQSNPK